MILKRFFDLLLVLVSMPIWLILLAIITILVRMTMGGPVFFIQARGGYKCREFNIYKLRTMKNIYDANGELLPDQERMTRLGKFLRKTSLDELPSLFNVLKGEMSLVGPRPFLISYMELYSPQQNRRHDVRPGITGWAQVNGRNAISWEEKFKLDVWYVDNRSFWLDIKILFMTILRTIRRDGISAQGEVTMPRFTGSHKAE